MNRFRAKRRAKDEALAPRPSTDGDGASPFKLFGKKKLPDTDLKQNLNLDNVLPSSDDFRTSLLMTGLSARFSMLREQDDPHSKLGKASDDSVLFPKRQSRLMDLGHLSNLHDIAESESIKASTLTRINSSQGSEDNDAGNIMDRARPNDGNNLFGGRQKIYRLAASTKSCAGGMGGRILYENDVAKSAFQKYRQAEKERSSFEENDTLDSENGFDYNKRRATNSTTSSGASAGRNSTAATSITSQVFSAKDGQFTIPPSASNVERSFARTRRLYEQGLTQDLQDQQSSALSRMDTFSKYHRGKITPESPAVPSPTSSIFNDRMTERRTILTKASAPNLRSYTPPASVASHLSTESAAKFTPELRGSFGASPPLSPPISETDDAPKPSGLPNERCKATAAMGVANRPIQQHENSKFMQRQPKPPSGHNAFDTQIRSASQSVNASKSRSSSVHRDVRDGADNASHVNDGLTKKDCQSNSFFDDNSDDGSGPTAFSNLASTMNTQTSGERPSDQDHPAFRKSALPTPLSLSSRASDNSSLDGNTDFKLHVQEHPSNDSPTLGPGPGLSGMVRQHLRGDSNASSIHDMADVEPLHKSLPPTSNKAGIPLGRYNSSHLHVGEPRTESGLGISSGANQNPPANGSEHDEFARHLADGARRVREKLTSYSEPDQEQALPPLPPSLPPPPPPPELTKDMASSRNNALGILRSKSSRTSLFDRGRDRDSDSKTKNGKSPASSSRKASVDAAQQEASVQPVKDDNIPTGLKAFRQARRELQKMKEQEVQQRYGPPPHNPGARLEQPTPPRAPHYGPESSSPPYQLSGSSNGHESSERDRSGSDSSRDGSERQRRRIGFSGQAYLPRRQELADPRVHGLNLPGTMSSTPNMHAPSSAPPLPPINPRRKNGLAVQGQRTGERVGAVGTSEGPYHGNGEEQRRRMYRTTSEQNDNRLRRYPPPPTHRPPLPHGGLSGRMI